MHSLPETILRNTHVIKLQYCAITDTIDIAANKPTNRLEVIYGCENLILRPVNMASQYSGYWEPPICTCTILL